MLDQGKGIWWSWAAESLHAISFALLWWRTGADCCAAWTGWKLHPCLIIAEVLFRAKPHRNCWRQHAVSAAGYCAGARHDSYNKSLISNCFFFALKEAKSHDPFRSSLVEVCWSRGLVYFLELWTESSPLKMENCPHHCPLDFFTAECRTGGRMSTVTSATCLGIDADVSVIRVNSAIIVHPEHNVYKQYVW